MVKLGGRPEHSHTHCISLAEHSPNHMMCVCMHAKFRPTLSNPWTVACQAPLPIEFSRQEYRSGLPFPSPGDLPTQGSYLHLITAPALAGGFFTTSAICCLVVQSCLTLSNPMDCSTPGFPVLRHLLEIIQTHVHWVSDAIQLSHPLSFPSPAFSLSQHQGLF